MWQKPLIAALIFLINPFGLSAQDLASLKKEKWVSFHGNINSGTNLYGISGIDARKVPFSAFANGTATLTLKGFSLPFSFQVVTPLTDKDNTVIRQPFNQFGVSPTWKKVKLHLGWRNMSFSRYTLDGHIFLGAGVEANPGRFRIGAMYGRFAKAVDEDSSRQAFNRTAQYPFAAYTRWGYGVKLGYGKGNRTFDLIYFKGTDDVSSAKSAYSYQMVAPGENAVVGMKTKIAFLKKFTFEADAAVSAYTRDTRSDSVAVDENYVKYASAILSPRLSTQAYYAGDALIAYRHKTISASLKFQRIMPDYRSFGTYYMQTDVQRITLNPSWYHPKGFLQLSGSFGTEKDNLASKKRTETTRNIGSLNMVTRLSKSLGASLQYSNYGSSQRAMQRSVSDTQLLNQVTNNISASPYYLIMGKNSTHTLMYLFSNQTLNDRNKINSQDFSMNVVNHTFTWAFANNPKATRMDFSVFTINTAIPNDSAEIKASNLGGSLGFGKTFNKKLNTHMVLSYSTNAVGGQSDGNTIQARWNNSLTAGKRSTLMANFTLTRNNSKSQLVARSFTEYMATLMYGYNF